MTKLAFVCVGNAGRSQLATAFAEQERANRGLEHAVEIVTGGVDPRDHVHDDVRTVLEEEGIDIGDREPRQITSADVVDAEYVITMGCAPAEFVPDDWDGETETWDLEHPGGDDLDATRAQRDEIQRRVRALFDHLETTHE
ncbi:low molecular weight phosphatase family protein [Natronolimnobius sp. AArcel1]|uniref:arsenate-mycothiol transferase ArsC n=1 Tax=Natronolimnobius sp. AArcel1 TaxID=1679093 RepID=UPI0013EB7F8C|nr:low molecular weight phosphatase family protein [Natronolimnobius sp. AArcel1]NGM67431.1 low molecular weight phosphatase family protein [Natronolimnobius sp. AArcel1]